MLPTTHPPLLLIFLVVLASSTFVPQHYEIALDLRKVLDDEDNPKIQLNSTVTIQATVLSNVSDIRLNAWRLTFSQVSLKCANVKQYIFRVRHKPYVDDTVTFELRNNLTAGSNCTLKINYLSPLTEMYGLYRSYFPSKFEMDKFYISLSTHNEPSLARLWVPSMDTTSDEAMWTLKIHHPNNTRVLGFSQITILPTKQKESKLSTFTSTEPMQAGRINFALFNEKNYKTHSAHTKHKKAIRFWFPRNITLKMKTAIILKESVEFFDYLEELFDFSLKCKTIEVVAQQHKTGASSGCLIIVDHMHNLTIVELRSRFAKLWLGGVVKYRTLEDAWFTHSLSYYLALNYRTDHSMLNLQVLSNTVNNMMILEEPLIPKIKDTWRTLFMYPNKGVMLITMIADVMGQDAFNETMKELLLRFANQSPSHNQIFYFLREFTSRNSRPACYRAFLDTHTEFIGFPILEVRRQNSSLLITQRNFAAASNDPRYRPWLWISQWTVPVYHSINGNEQMSWLHHDDEMLVLDVSANETVLIDPHSKGLYLVEFETDELVQMFTKHMECSLFHRYCLDPAVNADFCGGIYSTECRFQNNFPVFVYYGTRHKWDD